MECNFTPGQQVVCVDASCHPTKLQQGAVYTVERVGPGDLAPDHVFVFLRGVVTSSGRPAGWYPSRFRPVTRTSTGMQALRALLNPAPTPAPTPEPAQ